MDIRDQRAIELAKYQRAYKHESYGMGKKRRSHAVLMLKATLSRDSYLDVGCGRGEMLDLAHDFGYKKVAGTEVVDSLIIDDRVRFAIATDLPFEDNAFETVSCFDVLEHLLPADTVAALNELDRVCSKQLILTANNQQSVCNGQDLHINKREYAQWDKLIRKHTTGYCQWVQRPAGQISETWLVTKAA